jgi:hypothetical protein
MQKLTQRTIIFLSVIIIIFSAFDTYAQDPTEYSVTSIVPPSPNVLAFNKYVDMPVSYYTGTPQISVPIYELKMNNFTLPISLSYHAAGLKVEERASWVGAGWTLNATGVISRTTRNIPDEYNGIDSKYGIFSDFASLAFNEDGTDNRPRIEDCSNGFQIYNEIPNTTGKVDARAYPDSVAFGFIDSEPDLYHFNFPGGSGKFVFNHKRELIMLEATDTKVSDHPFETSLPVINGVPVYDTDDYYWKITDNKGIEYFFEKAEWIETYSLNSSFDPDLPLHYQNAWYLTKIVAYSDEINFNYTREQINYDAVLSESMKFRIGILASYHSGGPTTDPMVSSSNSYNINSSSALRLTSIATSNGDLIEFKSATTDRVDLAGSKSLENITIWKSGEFVTSFDLDYSITSNSPKLFLDQVIQKDYNGNALPPYIFEYNSPHLTPDIDNKSQDLWGYFNGSGSNSMIPEFKNDYYHLGKGRSKRLPRLDKAIIGNLKSITYPTGGYTEYEYGLHEQWNENYKQTYTHEISNSDGTNLTWVEKTQLFTIGQDCSITIDKGVIDDDPNYDNLENYAALQHFNTSTLKWETASLAGYTKGNRSTIPSGDYRLYTINMESDETYIKVEFEQIEPKNEIVGGLRVAKIRSYDPVESDFVLTKTFEYKNIPGQSSGVQFTPPILGQYETTHTFGYVSNPVVVCYSTDQVLYYNIGAYSQLPMTYVQGSHIGYSKVIVKNIDGIGVNNGSTEYNFINDIAYYSNYPFVPAEDLSHKNGKLLSERYFVKGSALPVKETVYEYEEITQPLFFWGYTLKVQNSSYCYACNSGKNVYDRYKLKPIWHRIKKVSNIDYATDGSSIEGVKNYNYQSSEHFNPTEITTNQSGTSNLTQKQFRYAINKPGLLSYVSNYNGAQFKSSADYLYHDTRPSTIINYINGSAVENKTAINFQFDNDLIISKETLKQDVSEIQESYLWDVEHNYVTASVVNAGPEEIAYSSFENSSKGNWVYNQAAVQSGASHTGVNNFNLNGNIISKAIPSNGKWIFTFFAKDEANLILTYNGINQPLYSSGVSNGWTQYSSTIEVTDPNKLLTLQGTGQIDEVRCHPYLAQMTTYTYEIGKGLTSQTDPNGISKQYIYDSFGRLKFIKDEDKNILTQYNYHYANEN